MGYKPTWSDLPQVGDGHPSEDEHYIPNGIGPGGEEEYRTVTTPCGEWRAGSGKMFCKAHIALLEDEYPQGWDYYPGDICPHGKYVGGSGIDLMCMSCELETDD